KCASWFLNFSDISNQSKKQHHRSIEMARGVVLVAAVLALAAAVAHAGRLLEAEEEYYVLEAAPGMQPASSPYASPGGTLVAGAGGGGGRHGWRRGAAGTIVDALWFVFRWANDAVAAGGGRMNDR
uniref:Uncharacterized protein n=1 Tax=Oryza brachyantha TaxID=4533 RepID=J3MGS2_ORYBR